MGRGGARRRCGRRRHVGGACAEDARAGRGSAVFDQSISCENAVTIMYDTGRCVLRPMAVLLHIILRSAHAPASLGVCSGHERARALADAIALAHAPAHTHLRTLRMVPLRI